MIDGDWIARTDGSNILPEYRPAIERICTVPKIMCNSYLKDRIERLSSLDPDVNFDKTLVDVIRKAYELSSTSNPRLYTGEILVSDVTESDCDNIPCNYFNSCMAYVNSLSWERNLFMKALEILLEEEDPDGLQVIIGLMARASRECAERKRFSFCAIINRVTLSEDAKEVESKDDIPEYVRNSKDRLLEGSIEYINELKEKAVKSTFIEPSLLYCSVTSDTSTLEDIEIRGEATYLAMLQASTGICTSRLPCLEDEAKGVVDFLESGLSAAAMIALWSNENLGKSYKQLADCRACKIKKRVTPHQFIWPKTSWISTKEYANLAIDSAEKNKPFRDKFAAYVGQFSSYFTEENLVPRLFTALTTGLSCHCEDVMINDLNVVYRYLTGAAMTEDVRHFVWDYRESLTEPSFLCENARKLFDFIGVTKPSHFVLLDASEPSPLLNGSLNLNKDCLVPRTSIRLTAAGDIRGGPTGREFLGNLLLDGREPWNKWVHPGPARTSFVQADFIDGGKYICEYGVCSANDLPARDPATFMLKGKVETGGKWIVLHVVESCPFSSRWQWVWYGIDQRYRGILFSSVRLEINSVVTPGQGIALGHFHIKMDINRNLAASKEIPLPLFSLIPADAMRLTAGGDVRGGSTGKEYLTNLLNDGTEPWNKWVHPGDVRSTFVQANFVGEGKYLAEYGLCSANDCPHRDPASLVLKGRMASTGKWVVLHVLLTCPFTSRWQWVWYEIDARFRGVLFSGVRLEINDVVAPGDGIQLGHFHLKMDNTQPSATGSIPLAPLDASPPLPQMHFTPPILPSIPRESVYAPEFIPRAMQHRTSPPTVTAPLPMVAPPIPYGQIIPREAIRLFVGGDQRLGTNATMWNLLSEGREPWNKWVHPGNVLASFIQADFVEGKYISEYGICSATDFPHRDPASMILYGRTMTGDTMLLHAIPRCPFNGRSQWIWYGIDNRYCNTLFSAVRLEITSVVRPGDGLQLAHFLLKSGGEQNKPLPFNLPGRRR